MKHRWTTDELTDLSLLTWEEFNTKYPYRTYDSWEVKRRRINGGSAGTRQVHVSLAEQERVVAAVNELAAFVSRWPTSAV